MWTVRRTSRSCWTTTPAPTCTLVRPVPVLRPRRGRAAAGRGWPSVTGQVLVAGVGNIFLGDDGFGPRGGAPAGRHRAARGRPGRGLRHPRHAPRLRPARRLRRAGHRRRGLPRRPSPATWSCWRSARTTLGDAGTSTRHGMEPTAMLASLGRSAAGCRERYVVGCEPADVGERIGLTAPVAAAVDRAVEVVTGLLARGREEGRHESGRLGAGRWSPGCSWEWPWPVPPRPETSSATCACAGCRGGAVHETGYCDGVLHAVEDRAAGARVARIGVRVGSLHRIVPGRLRPVVPDGGRRAAWPTAPTTEVTIVPARGSCDSCGREFTSRATRRSPARTCRRLRGPRRGRRRAGPGMGPVPRGGG